MLLNQKSNYFSFTLLVALLPLIFGCEEKKPQQLPNQSAIVTELQSELDSLRAAYQAKDKQLTEISQAVEIIQQSLLMIQNKEKQIRLLEKSTIPDKFERSKQILFEINEYLKENRKRIAELEEKVANTPRASTFQGIISTLKQSIEKIEGDSKELKKTVANLNTKIGELNQTIEEKNKEIARKNQELAERAAEIEEKNRVLTAGYYITGTRDELLTYGIIKKSGGVIGIGKTYKVSERLDKSQFKTINTKSVSNIDLGSGKSVKIISVHPAEAYTLESAPDGSSNKLVISDAGKFWSVTRFLVVQVQ